MGIDDGRTPFEKGEEGGVVMYIALNLRLILAGTILLAHHEYFFEMFGDQLVTLATIESICPIPLALIRRWQEKDRSNNPTEELNQATLPLAR